VQRPPRTTSPNGADGSDNLRRVLVAVAAVAVVVVAAAGLRSARDGDGDGGGRKAVAEPSGTTAPTTSTTLRHATERRPLRILVVGDSLVGWIPKALDEALAGRPAEVIDAWKGSSGLARPDFYDWPAELARLVDEHDPDIVVVGFGGNDTQSLVSDDGVLQRGDPAWEVEYGRRVGQVLDAAEGPGRTLWWIGLPLSQRDNVEALRPVITRAIDEELSTRPWARFVDAAEVLSPDGSYQVMLPGPDGEPVRVRADDGIHLSPAGGRMVVDAFLGDLEAERGLG
jgi:hypothetical protein